MKNKTYEIKAGGGKISAALAKLCAQGQMGESLVRSGVSQDAFCLFLAKLATAHLSKGKTPEQLADVFLLVSGGNSSAARQSLGKCSLRWDSSDKDQSVEAYWILLKEEGGDRAAPNLSALDL